jgi:phosphoadenosine phosphosulfate reductase
MPGMRDAYTALKLLPPAEGLAWVAQHFSKPVFSTALGEEDQVITHLIARERLNITIFTLDTGRLFPESYELLSTTVAAYRQPIQTYFPEAQAVEQYVSTKGINAFYNSVEERKECCHIRKVLPLNRALAGADLWITGVRSAQSANRLQMDKVEWDEQRQLIKYNPLLDWTDAQLKQFIDLNNVPINTLHKKGFASIGCAPCTRAIEPGEEARAGRWWWEQSAKECGLHVTQ